MEVFYRGNRAGGAVWLTAGVLVFGMSVLMLLIALGVVRVPGGPSDAIGRLPFLLLSIIEMYASCYLACIGLALSVDTRIRDGIVEERDLFGREKCLRITAETALDRSLMVVPLLRGRVKGKIPRSYAGLHRIQVGMEHAYVNLPCGWRKSERGAADEEKERLASVLRLPLKQHQPGRSVDPGAPLMPDSARRG